MRKVDLLAYFDFWWRATRAPFLTASIMPVLLGGALVFNQNGQLNWVTFVLSLIAAVSVHLGANLLNDYGDHLLGSDARNEKYTPFSGGSRLIQTGLIKPSTIFRVGITFLIITVVIGLILIYLTAAWGLLIFGIGGVFIAIAYSLPPFKLAFRGWGELAVSLAFGPLIVGGTVFVQTQSLDWQIILIAIPAGLLVGLILYINEVQDEAADRVSQKNTLVVKMQNIKRALQIYRLALAFCFILTAVLIFTGLMPLMALIYLLTLPMLQRIWRISKQEFQQPQEILPVNALTIQLQILFTGLLVLALVLDRLL